MNDQPVSFVDEIRQAAENIQNENGFVYEPTSGLYYDRITGYYYNAVMEKKPLSVALKSNVIHILGAWTLLRR